MVRLTRLNNQPLVVNSDLIKFVEQSPDTLITLINGEKFMVRESAEEVITRIVEFRQEAMRGIVPYQSRLAAGEVAGGPASGRPSDEQEAER